jgi:hypothetical protein
LAQPDKKTLSSFGDPVGWRQKSELLCCGGMAAWSRYCATGSLLARQRAVALEEARETGFPCQSRGSNLESS